MLNVGNERLPLCPGHGPTRRSFLQAGTAGLAGMVLPNLMRLEAGGAVDEQQGEDHATASRSSWSARPATSTPGT